MSKKALITLLLMISTTCLWGQTDSLWRDTTVEISGEWEVRRIEPQQKKNVGAILNNLTIPLELGCAFTPKMGQTRSGFYMRTSLEYREYKTTGWSVAAELDSYTRSYELENVNNVNITKGRDWTLDILAGGGYRVPFVRDVKTYRKRPIYDNIWSMGFMLFAGASCQTLEYVAMSETNANGDHIYHIETLDQWVPTMKLTASVEYTVSYGISVYATVGYLQHIRKTNLEFDYVGELISSLGIAFFFR